MGEMSQEQLEAIMGLIVNAGNAKSDAMEAIQAAKNGEFEEADEKLKAAEAALLEAHHAQTKLLTAETNGEALTITLLTIHSQDHLMTSITFNDLAKEVIDVYRRLG
jgi:PTS system cellobiose-specific IIA component